MEDILVRQTLDGIDQNVSQIKYQGIFQIRTIIGYMNTFILPRKYNVNKIIILVPFGSVRCVVYNSVTNEIKGITINGSNSLILTNDESIGFIPKIDNSRIVMLIDGQRRSAHKHELSELPIPDIEQEYFKSLKLI